MSFEAEFVRHGAIAIGEVTVPASSPLACASMRPQPQNHDVIDTRIPLRWATPPAARSPTLRLACPRVVRRCRSASTSASTAVPASHAPSAGCPLDDPFRAARCLPRDHQSSLLPGDLNVCHQHDHRRAQTLLAASRDSTRDPSPRSLSAPSCFTTHSRAGNGPIRATSCHPFLGEFEYFVHSPERSPHPARSAPAPRQVAILSRRTRPLAPRGTMLAAHRGRLGRCRDRHPPLPCTFERSHARSSQPPTAIR